MKHNIMPSTRSLDDMAYISQSAYLILYLSAGLPFKEMPWVSQTKLPHLLTRKSARSKNSPKSRGLPPPPPPMINVATGLKGNAWPISLIQTPGNLSRELLFPMERKKARPWQLHFLSWAQSVPWRLQGGMAPRL